MPLHRLGFARIESLVVAALGILAAGLVLPAMQKVRAEANRAGCTDNLRKIGAALHAYENTHGELPPGATNSAGSRCSWAVFVLPQLGEENLFKNYRTDLDWFDPANQAAINTPLKVFQCPDSPTSRVSEGDTGGVTWKGATSDYVAHDTLDGSVVNGMGVPPEFDRRGIFQDRRPTRFAEVTDGLASTLMVSEAAGRPEHWVFGKKIGTMPMTEYGVWAARQHKIQVHGHAEDGRVYPGPCAINCTNWRGLYSFHKGHINTCFADGSVRSLREGMNVYVLYSLISVQGGELIAPQDY